MGELCKVNTASDPVIGRACAASEVAEMLGLAQHNSVTTYLRRYADFPRPVVDKSGGHIRFWLRSDIERWSER